ncbi:sensor histidine kinase [Vallitalea okinawensis]|uniref:sensor histidine kinase n=1 Tax=Vallitalea okinawensis TaxID=2078660 RepID=UPI001478A28A|nr:sensor histidine kinase [Vallitalea okinawensis]
MSYILVSMIPITVLGIYSYKEAKDSLINQSNEVLQNAINKVADNISHDQDFYNNIINSIAFNIRIQQIFSNNYTDMLLLVTDLRDFLNPFFNNIMDIHEEIKQITVYTKSDVPEYGQYIQSYDKLDGMDWADEIMKSKITRWFYQDGKLFSARKMNDTISDLELGIVFMELDYDRILNSSARINVYEYGLVIMDKENNIILSENTLSDNSLEIPDYDLKEISEGTIRYNKNEYIVASSSTSNEEWRIICYVPTHLMTGGTIKILSTTMIIVGICLVVVMVIIWLFSHTMVKRIDKLNDKMGLVEQGNLGIEVKSQSVDEIGELTNKFGRMVKRINSLIEEVYQKELTQKAAELKALQAQINPHFLYNTLSVMKWKAMDVDADELSNMITLLSKFYRTSLNTGKIITSVKNEVDNTKSYVEIQQIVHENSFDVTYKIDDIIYNYDTLNLILQPLVENALEHGIFKKKKGFRRLTIKGGLRGQYLEFVVEDSGVGIKEEVLNTILEKESNGYGVKNVNERIKLFFGDNYGLSIQSEDDKGTAVYVYLPQFIANKTI